MLESLKNFFASESFIPHGHCYLWKPQLVGLHVVSDLLIALAYYSIPIMLVYFIQKRRDTPFQEIVLMFGAFIIACGTSHLMGIWTLWHPDYWLFGGIKLITALVSVYTAVQLFTIIPKVLTLPSPTQLDATNQKLAQEIRIKEAAIRQRIRAEATLRLYQEHLEELVIARTSELLKANEQLSWQASHDALTGLVNRREFERCLEKAVYSARTSQHKSTLCYMDLDRFKIINDTCGHLAGDELLRQISSLLQSRCRKSDTLARLGGDEFGLLLYQCSLDEAMRVIQMLHEFIQEFRFVWQDKTFTLGVSIGLVEINVDSLKLEDVLNAADTACYAAKHRGRNQVHVYQISDRELQQQW
jgi:diguanylate cyclase (GGDEF)-like protein